MSIEKHFMKSKNKCKVTFKLPQKATNGGSEVKVVGDFNDWDWESGITMKKSKEHYVATKEFPVGKTFQFRYLIDDRDWENDWNADDYAPTPFGVENSVLDTTVEEAVQGLMHFSKN